MPKPKNIIPSRRVSAFIPETEAARLDLLLYSEAEGRVPQGSYRAFMLRAIREACEYKSLDLSPYAGTSPGNFVVRGSATAIEILERVLKGL